MDITVFDRGYAAHDPSLQARVYQPAGTGPYPVLIDVHGGVWNSGDRTTGEMLDQVIAASGVLVVGIDFRQPPQAGYPASIADVHLAVRWARAHAAEFGGDPSVLGGLGTSSGGHQLLLVAMRPDDPRYAALSLPEAPAAAARLDFLTLCWPIVDPLARYQWACANGKQKLVDRHDAYWGTEAAMAEGNPRLLLDHGGHAPLPPALIVQGSADQNIPSEIVADFARRYQQAGGPVRFELFAGEPHGFIKRRPAEPAARRSMDLIISFIKDAATSRTTARSEQ
ncbi:MAG TPA: alpha/beta hydrolase [Trebonia sp.]|jgi:acetyl esterase/lipase